MSALHALLSRLNGVRRVGALRYMARCPGHADRHASLSITMGRDGRLLLHDHGGCKTQTILTALKMAWADLFADGPPMKRSSERNGFNPRVCELDAVRDALLAEERRNAQRRAPWATVAALADEARELDRLLLRARQTVSDLRDDRLAWELEELGTELQRMMMAAEAQAHETVAGRSLW